MNETTLVELLEWGWLSQGTFCLSLGLMGSLLLRRHAARAHQVLRLGMLAAMLLPLLSLLVHQQGLGLLPVAVEPELVSVVPAEVSGSPARVSPLTAHPAFAMDSVRLVTESAPPAIPVEPEAVAAVRVSPSPRRFSWVSLALAVWLVVGLFLLFRLLRTAVLALRLLRRAEPCERAALLQALQRARTRLSVPADVTLKESRIIDSPVIWCWRSGPVILVQRDIERCPHTDWVSVFCHELAHWKRGDHRTGLWAELWFCVFWWHPLVGWAKKRLEILSEQACDDWVLACGQSGPDYAESLLGLVPETQRAFLPTVVGKDKTMKDRIIRIVKQQSGNPRVGRSWALALVLLTSLLIVGTAFAQRRSNEVQHEHPEGWRGGAVVDRRGEAPRQDRLADEIRDVSTELKDAVKKLEELEERGRGDSDDAHALRRHIEAKERRLPQLGREMEASARRQPHREERSHDEAAERREQLVNEMKAVEARLGESAERLHDLEEEGEGDSREARNFRQVLERMEQRLHQLHREMEALDRRPERPERELAERREGILHRMEEVRAKIDETLHELHEREERGRGDSDEAHRLRQEVGELERVLHNTEQLLHALERHHHEGEQHARHAHLRELEARQHELHQHASRVEERLERLGDEYPERAEGLHRELAGVRDRLERIERARHEMRGSEPGPRPEMEEMEHHHRELEVRQHELHQHARRVEERLARLGDEHPERAEGLHRELAGVRDRLERIERARHEMHGPEPRPRHEREEMEHHHRELEMKAEGIHRALEALGDSNPEIRGRLESELHALHARMEEVERAVHNENRVHDRPELEVRVNELNERVEHLGHEMREIRGLLERLVEQRDLRFEVEEVEVEVERRSRRGRRRETRDRDDEDEYEDEGDDDDDDDDEDHDHDEDDDDDHDN